MDHTILRGGDLEVDLSTGTLRTPSGSFSLRPKTAEVLAYLMEHNQRPVPKNELIATVWGETSVTEDVLFGCILEIRRALGDNPKEPQYIRTLPKRGYQFIAAEPVPARPADAIEPAPPSELPPEAVAQMHTESAEKRPSRWFWVIGGVAIAIAIAIAAILLLGGQAHWPTNSSRAGEVAWWKFDGGGTSALPVTSMTGVESVPGRLGTALRFSGQDSAIRGTDPDRLLPLGEQPRTLTVWIRTDSTNGDKTPIVHYGNAKEWGPSDSTRLLLEPSGRVLFQNHANFPAGVRTVRRVDDGAWHFLAASYSGAPLHRARVFVDGEMEGQETLAAVPAGEGASVWAIAGNLWPNTPFRGELDDVRVFARELRGGEIRGLQRCVAGDVDVEIPGRGAFFFTPVHDVLLPGIFLSHIQTSRIASTTTIRNDSLDLGGAMLTRRAGDCAIASLRGADAGQDMRIHVELLAPPGPNGEITQAGPYFRSRSAAPGDGTMGGTSAGFLVRLNSSGAVDVLRLNPRAVLAFAPAPSQFDSSAFHALDLEARGESLTVWLDGSLVSFDQAGRKVSTVAILPAWENPKVGSNDGAAGVLFVSDNRSQAGRQAARNFRVDPLAAAESAGK